MGTLKSIVREEFARKKSALIVVPTVMAAEETAELLRKGIEDYVVILHGSLAKKKQETAWKTAITETHPLLIITTPYFASVPRKDLSTVILERESSRAYHSPVEPFIDYRFYIEELARHSGCRLILSDSLLRAETLYRRENGSVQDFFPLSYRIEKGAELIVTDTSKKKDKFEAMSEELQSMIEHAGKKSERMFIFSSRRGLAPQTVCEDCGLTVTCDNCSAPLVLHKSRNEHDRYFLCHHCGSQQDATEAACKRCGSWKLKMLGIASDTIAEEIRKQFPDRRLFILDRDAVKTDKQAKTLVKEFLETKTGILLGTESALAFLPEVAYSAIASLDSLFSLPDFRINERICRIILRLLEKTTWYTLIQTRDGDNGVLKHIASGSLMAFCKEELEMREALNYPPYSTHIKATVEGTKEEAAERMKKLQDLLADNAESVESMIFPAFIPTQKGKSVLHMLLTVPSDEWPNAHNIHKLRALLASLPKDYSVRVEPDSLL